MKSKVDPRHLDRLEMVKSLFSASFKNPNVTPKIKPVVDLLPQIDTYITQAAPEWPLEQINKVDLAVLRVAIYELQMHETPPKVVIDEAVEIAKEYGSENSGKFVNGVLGTVVEQIYVRSDTK